MECSAKEWIEKTATEIHLATLNSWDISYSNFYKSSSLYHFELLLFPLERLCKRRLGGS